MGHIRLLSAQIANQIAAGEVVERPSSVLKELVENAIDANSQKIDVTIEDGGIKSIRVVDDGNGMDAEDLQIAFERHATSKIRSTKDLFAIRSLGFRGEALPSIAAVSCVECISATDHSGLAHRIYIEGGNQKAFGTISGQRGTDFRVNDLFFNTPARLKYMKTVQTELSHMTDYMYRLSLSRPDIAFRLHHNGTSLLDTSGNGDLKQTIAAVYGVATAKKMLFIQDESPDFHISGWIASPEVTRSNRAGITIVVNGRFVKNFSVVQAVLAGYHTLLPIHRFPVCIIHLRMDPTIVDVNVHPAKLEVRFSKEAELIETVQSVVRRALRQVSLIPSGGSLQDRKVLPPIMRTASPVMQEQMRMYTTSQAEHRWTKQDTGRLMQAMTPGVGTVSHKESSHERIEENHPPVVESRFPKLFPIGQTLGTYVLAQNDEGLYLIDQHAAHERIHYEYYVERFGNIEAISQIVLFAHTLEFTLAESQLLRERLQLLESVGVYLEPFGGNTFKVRSLPSWFPHGDETSLIDEMVQWVLEEKQPNVGKIREASAIICACKASIKANQSQSLYAIEKLLEQLANTKNPFTCPHGRPILVHFSKRDLEKMFKRVM
jgi:DNA mismatch repair protein MutL